MYVQSLSCVWLFAAPMGYSPPGSSVHGFPGKNTGAGCHFLLQGLFPTQGSNLHLLRLLHWQANSLLLAPLGKPFHCATPPQTSSRVTSAWNELNFLKINATSYTFASYRSFQTLLFNSALNLSLCWVNTLCCGPTAIHRLYFGVSVLAHYSIEIKEGKRDSHRRLKNE